MRRTVLDGARLTAGERLAAAREELSAGPYPMSVGASDIDRFHAALRTVELSAAHVLELSLAGCEVWRTERQVRQTDPDLVCFTMVRSGAVTLRQSGSSQGVLEPGDLVLHDSARPFRLSVEPGRPGTVVRVHLGRARLGLPEGRIDGVTERGFARQPGFPALLAQFLDSLFSVPETYGPQDLPRMDLLAQDLLPAVAARHVAAGGSVQAGPRQRRLMLRIETFVRQNLHVPDLSPVTIADAHHISVGYLHKLFSAHEHTVAQWVRVLRLEHIRRDLADPMLHHLPLFSIANRWGFTEHSSFTRSFRTAYGLSPRDYRDGVLGAVAA